MSLFKVYSGAECIAMFGPVNLMPGRSKDEFIRFEKIGDDPVDSESGIDGEVVVYSNKDERYNAILTLMQSSNVNEQLSTMLNAAISVPGMIGAVHPFEFKDPNGSSLYTAANAIIKKFPDSSFGEKVGTREWTIFCAQLKRVDGGNTPR